MDITITQIFYVIVFLAILCAVEGVYMLVRGLSSTEEAVNRRMKVAQQKGVKVLHPSLLRREVEGGPVSKLILLVMPKLGELLWSANIKMSPATYIGVSLGAAAAVFAGVTVMTGMPPFRAFAIALFVGIAIPFLVVNSIISRRRRKFSTQLPDAIDLVTRGLEAGHPVPVALELVSQEMQDPIGSEFGIAIDEINYGLDRDVALRSIAYRYPDPNFKFFLAAVEMQRETGGNLVDVLRNLTKVVRERENMRRKAFALSAEGRLTCFIVGGLPFGLVAGMLVVNPGFYLDVIDDPAFWPAIGVAFMFWAIGIAWIWKMVNFKV